MTSLKILLLTTHIFSSKHKAGFHFIAAEFCKMGHQVTFCTIPNTPLHIIVDLFKNPTQIGIRIRSFLSAFWPGETHGVRTTSFFSLFFNTPRSNVLAGLKRKIFLSGFCAPLARDSFDVVVFESSACLFLFSKIKGNNPRAKLIYRASDPLFVLKSPLLLLQIEKDLLPQFDLVSTPNEQIGDYFKNLAPEALVQVLPHGVDFDLMNLAKSKVSPFKTVRNFVFVGMFLFDEKFLEIASRIRPDCNFYLIGSFQKRIERPNVFYTGILPMIDALSYVAFSDVGLLTRRTEIANEMMARSLKFYQYAYYRKPIVAPVEMNLKEPFVFEYILTDLSIKVALEKALSFDFSPNFTMSIEDWSTVALKLLRGVDL